MSTSVSPLCHRRSVTRTPLASPLSQWPSGFSPKRVRIGARVESWFPISGGAASSQHTDVLATLRSQLAIEPLYPDVPKAALTLLDLVRAEVRSRPLTDAERQRGLEFDDAHASGDRSSRARPLSADERGNAKKHKSSTIGHGLGNFDNLFGLSSIPGVPRGSLRRGARAPARSGCAAARWWRLHTTAPSSPRAAHAFNRFAHLFPTPSIPGALTAQASAPATQEQRTRPSVPMVPVTHALLHGGPGHRSSVKGHGTHSTCDNGCVPTLSDRCHQERHVAVRHKAARPCLVRRPLRGHGRTVRGVGASQHARERRNRVEALGGTLCRLRYTRMAAVGGNSLSRRGQARVPPLQRI